MWCILMTSGVLDCVVVAAAKLWAQAEVLGRE